MRKNYHQLDTQAAIRRPFFYGKLMCEVLIRKHTLDEERQAGEIIYVAPDNWQWARRESKRVWIAEGLPEEEYPDHFQVVKVQNCSVEEFKAEMIVATNAPPLLNVHLIDFDKLSSTQRKRMRENDIITVRKATAFKVGKANVSPEVKASQQYQKTDRFKEQQAIRDQLEREGIIVKTPHEAARGG